MFIYSVPAAAMFMAELDVDREGLAVYSSLFILTQGGRAQ